MASICCYIGLQTHFIVSNRTRAELTGNGVRARMAATIQRNASEATELANRWSNDPRWQGIERPYTRGGRIALRGRFPVEHTLGRLGAERLWELLNAESRSRALGAVTGGQAVQMVRAGLKAIYLSGWQVAAEANLAGHTYPDQSLYPANSVPALVRRLNNALLRADQIDARRATTRRTGSRRSSPTPRPASAAPLNAYELMKAMIEAGAAGVHFEDQLAAEKKCGHLGGKVLVPTSQFIRTLLAARLAADVLDVPTVLVARTDALSASLLTSDIDPADAEFVTGERTPEGFFRVRDGIEPAIARGARVRAVRRRALVRDLDARPRRGARVRRGDPRARTRASCSPTTARRRSTGSATSTTTRSRASARRSASSATASSSSRSPASTR